MHIHDDDVWVTYKSREVLIVRAERVNIVTSYYIHGVLKVYVII